MTHHPLARPRPFATAAALSLVLLLRAAPASAQAEPPLELKFADFFVQPVGPRGLTITDTLRAADGRRVRIVGYMVAQESPRAGGFMLTALPLQRSEQAEREADDLPPATVQVWLDASQRDRVVAHQPGLMALTGRLQVGRAADADGRVSWVRLLLDPLATADVALDRSAAAPSSRH